MQRLLNAIKALFKPKNYGGLLLSTLSVSLANSLISDLAVANAVTSLLASFVLVIAARSANMSRSQLRVNIILAVIGTLFVVPLVFDRQLDDRVVHYLQTLSILCGMVFVFNTMKAMLKDIFSSPITTNKISGAICVYMLIGVSFEFMYMLIQLHDPQAFRFSGDEHQVVNGVLYPNRSLFMYFSFCTLTTVGYGDIVPINRIARMLSWSEAVCGQMYLGILVARLVGLYIAAEMIKEIPAEEQKLERDVESAIEKPEESYSPSD